VCASAEVLAGGGRAAASSSHRVGELDAGVLVRVWRLEGHGAELDEVELLVDAYSGGVKAARVMAAWEWRQAGGGMGWLQWLGGGEVWGGGTSAVVDVDAVGPGHGVEDGEAHVGPAELRDDGRVCRLDGGVDDGLRVDLAGEERRTGRGGCTRLHKASRGGREGGGSGPPRCRCRRSGDRKCLGSV